MINKSLAEQQITIFLLRYIVEIQINIFVFWKQLKEERMEISIISHLLLHQI